MNFTSVKSWIYTLLFLLLANLSAFSAPTIELTTSNWESKIADKTVLVYMSLGCDIGGYASQMFVEAMEDLQGVYVTSFDTNSAYKMMQGKDYGLGTIALIRNGKVLESSKETYKDFHYLGGYNQQKIWVYEALKKHNIPFNMPLPSQTRLTPKADKGVVDLSRGVNAIYRFDNGLADESGKKSDFRLGGTAQIKNSAFYSDGKYDNNRTGGDYKAFPYGEKSFPNGFTVHANIKVNNSDSKRKHVLTFGYRMIDFEINEDKLLLSASLSEKVGGDNYIHTDDFYPLTEIPFKYDEWNSLIFSTDIDSRRMYLVVNGVRYNDIQLSKRFVEFFRKYGMDSPYGTSGVRTYNYGWGGILNGYADDIVVYERKLNDNELMALHSKYSKGNKEVKPGDHSNKDFMSPIDGGNGLGGDNGNESFVLEEEKIYTGEIKKEEKEEVSKETVMLNAWVGDWTTSFGDHKVYTHFRKSGNEIIGTYDFKGGKVKGKVTKQDEIYVFRGTWTQTNASGWFEFRMQHANEFEGNWGYEGEKSSGTWNGLK